MVQDPFAVGGAGFHGGVGLALSQWMVNGDPGFDVWAMDCARFGEWATRTYTNEKVRENYSRRFSIRFPNEELPAARPQQTTALYDIMLSKGAVMGDSWGLETPLWFAPKGVEPKDIDTAQIYDHFTSQVIMQLEDYGFCDKGEGGAFVHNGRLAIEQPARHQELAVFEHPHVDRLQDP